MLFVISLLSFSVQDSLGDPLREFVGQSVSEAEREALRDKLGLNDPWPERYVRFLANALQGDLGTSYQFKRPALEVILSKFPATFELVLVATIIIITLTLPAGIYCAVRPQSFGSRLLMSISTIGLSIPVFLTAIIMISIFAVWLNLLPSFGRGETVTIGAWETSFLTASGWQHIILPAITLSSIMLALFIRLTKSALSEELSKDYVRTAWAKGAPPHRIWINHAMRNASLPLVTIGGLQIGIMLAYTMLTETVFQWPGMGFLFLDSVNRADTPLIIAYIMVVGVIFVVTNTIVDLIYLLIDPRISLSGASNQ